MTSKMRFLIPILLAGVGPASWAQQDPLLLADDHTIAEAALADAGAIVDEYDGLSKMVGKDSIRHCQGYACNGWVEDKYPSGQLKHRGFYQEGQLLVYKNYHPNGQLEREFRSVDDHRCVLTTYYPNGAPHTEAKYFKGDALEWKDYYSNGQVRYEQEKHKSEPWYLKMNLYQPDGKPVSTMMLVDKKKNELEQKEYWPNGMLRTVGRTRFDQNRRDCQRIGTWTSYDEQGNLETDEVYVEGKVNNTVQR